MTLSRLFDSRLASLAVIAIGVLAALLIAVDAYAWRRDQWAEVLDLRHRTLLLEQRAAALATRDAGSEQTAAGAPILVYGDTPGLAVAELQRIITVSAGKSGATLRSIDTPQGETIAESRDAKGNLLQRVRISAEIEVDEQMLPDLLYAIETDKPVMIVDALTVRSNRRMVAGDATEWVAAADQPLILRLEISAFRSGSEQP